ncbi:trimethylamine methyltransferase family protein [Alphaproteobacteria bacterium]|nr:trimethylamine methyltransferase family protein [Alphaproteobacteria bacterium]
MAKDARSGKTHQTGQRTRRRRSGEAARQRSFLTHQLPWGPATYLDDPTQPIDAEGVEAIHNASMRILEEIGILFLNDDALKILNAAGCRVDYSTKNVRMGRDFVMEQVAKAPSQFTITPRNPDQQITFGGRHFNFGQVASAPNVMDLDRGRRVGTRADFQDLLRLAQSFNCIHFNCGYPVEPIDIHASVRHLDAHYDMLTLTDKVVHAYSLGAERIEDVMEMVRIAGGLSHDEFSARPHMFTNINSSSPLKHDWSMLDGAMRVAKRGQVVVVSPFTLAGAMAPVTIAGAITQQNAEGLAAIALLQLVRPGAPVIYGAFTSNVDMKTGAPAFGTPEYVRAMQMSGQMARHYGLPLRASNANAANAPDAQAMWESVFSLQGSCSGHANMIYHAAGWMEGGLSASFEKMVIDCEVLQQIIYTNQPVPISEDDLALDAISEVGPLGHFFGAEHTKSRYRDAFYAPILSDWSNYESWEEAGALWTHQRANAAWKQILAEYEPPLIDQAIDEELQAFVENRRREGGAPTDF